jgi:2-polyprenyl-3-methyl-5-hydroxy-6-metoxy-1,4-benzoquinol methylase
MHERVGQRASMITFRYANQTIQLGAGETWSAPSSNKTYRDTPTEELQAIVKDVENNVPWREVVGRHYAETNPWLHQIVTSPKRDLFFRQYPPVAGAKVIDIGAGWGQTSIPLAQAREVTALEPTAERLAFIRATAGQLKVASRMHFVQADFFDVEFESHFDLACCIGVLEWVPTFREGDPRALQIEFLKRIHSLLNPGGQLVLGIENRMGLKYLLGAADDHIGAPGIATFDMNLAARKWRKLSGKDLRSFTHTQSELEELLKAAGFHSTAFYAAVPDYKLPEIITPLGSATEAHFANEPYIPEHHGANGRPLEDEEQEELRSHYLSLARMGVAGIFAPSYFVVALNDDAVRPSSKKILQMLWQARKIERMDGVVLDLYPPRIERKDCGEKWAYKVARDGEVLFHLTVANGSLNKLYERAQAFAGACPNLACKPLFFLEVEGSSLQLFGQEYFEGETLDAAVARGSCDAEQWMASVDAAVATLVESTFSSSMEEYDKEVNQLKEAVLSFDALSFFDKLVLRDWVFPRLFEAGRRMPMHARWTNGDFHGGNILRNCRGEIRLVDYEFANITHFFRTDTFRLREFSVLPFELKSFPSVDPEGNVLVEELHFWLQHLQMLNAAIRPQYSLPGVSTIMERLLALTLEFTQDRSQIQAGWEARRNVAQSIAAERDVLRGERDVLRGERDVLGEEREALRLKTIEYGERIAELDSSLEHLRIIQSVLKCECDSIKTSYSWKLTAPLRLLRNSIVAIVEKAKKALRP